MKELAPLNELIQQFLERKMEGNGGTSSGSGAIV